MKESYLSNSFNAKSRPSNHLETSRSETRPNRFLNRLSDCILSWFDVPEGYQDESGFHYGPQPTATKSNYSGLSAAEELLTDRASEAFIYASAQAPTPEATASKAIQKQAAVR